MTGVFIAVLNMSLIASFAALGVIVIRILLHKAPKVFSYALWAIVLFKLLCPFTVETALSLIPVKAEPVPRDIIYSQNPSIDSGIPFVDHSINRAITNAAPPKSPAASASPMQAILFVLSCMWLAGIAVLLLLALVSYLRLKYRLCVAIPVQKNIYETDRIKTAFVLGFVRPKIYVPAGLSEQELDYIVKHEQTHIRRRDYLIKPLAFLAVLVHWFNPVIWLSYYLAMRDMELSCDESVLKHYGRDIRRDYSSSLLSLSAKQNGLISPLAFGETGVKGRIKNVLNYKKPAVWVSVAAIAAVTVAAVLLFPNAARGPEDISDEQIIEAIKNTDYFCYGEVSGGFSDVSQIPVGNLFNLYASTKEVQDKINALPSTEQYAEIPTVDFGAFVQKYFGSYQFAPEPLEEQLSGRVRFDSTDTEKKTIMLSGINGGVIWPGAVPYDIALENVVKDRDRIIVAATIHAYDNVSIDIYYKVEMQLAKTKDGYNYVSYGMAQENEFSDAETENITLEYSDESGVYTENYIKKTTDDSVTLLTEDGKEILSGEDVIPLPYVYAVKTNGRYDLLDKETQEKASSISYDEIFCEKYPDGRLSTTIMKGRAGNYWGLIGAKGKTLTNPQNQAFEDIQINTYEEVWPIIAVIEDGKYGAIDYDGKTVIEAEWGYLAMDVYNVPGTVFVFDGSKWGGIKLDKNLLASAVDYSLTTPEWIVQSYNQIMTDRPEMKWYYQMFRNDAAFKVLGSTSGDITDDQMATYAVLKMADYSYEDGNTKEEYNAITQKYFGRDIKNFDNGVTETIPGTDKIRATGWSYDNGVYVLAKDVWDNGDGSMTGDFYCVNVSDSHWTGEAGEFEEAESALLNGDISSFADCNISIKRVVFEVKTENGEQYFKYRSVKTLEENIKSIVLYSK